MAKKQLKGLTSSTTSLPRSVESILSEDEGAFGSPPFEDDGQAAGAQSAAEALLNSITSGAPVPSPTSASGAADGSGSGAGSGGAGAAADADDSGDAAAADEEVPAPGSVEEGAQILAEQTAAALAEEELESPGEELLDFGNGVLAYLANRLPMLGVAPCNFDPPGPPAPPPYIDTVVMSGVDALGTPITDEDGDNIDDVTLQPSTFTTYPGGPYDPIRILETTGLNIDQTMQLIMSEIYKMMTEGGGTTTIAGVEVPLAPPVPPPAVPEGNIDPLSVPNLKAAAIPTVGKHFEIGGEEFFECMTNIIKEAVEMAGGEVEDDPDPASMPGIPLAPFVWVYAPHLAPTISGDALKCIEILGPFLRLAYLIPPIPSIPALPILLAALPLILDCCGFGPGNHENLDAVMAASPIVGVITIANVILGWVLLITGLALDVMSKIESYQMSGSPMLLAVPPVFPPPNPIFVSPSSLSSVSMLQSGFDKAVMAWAAAHVPPVDLRIGGIIPLVMPI